MVLEKNWVSSERRRHQRMSVELFRAFYASRPDEEQWQLIDGRAVMMTPPTGAHQCIATNLQLLLLQSLERHAPERTAFQRLGLNLAPSIEGYDPEPDVTVIDASAPEDPNRRYVDRFYLAAEIVSASDELWVANKREIYKLHETCSCVLTIPQDRQEVRVDLRTDTGWQQQVLANPDDLLVLPDFGLRCKLADVYQGTALQPRKAAPR